MESSGTTRAALLIGALALAPAAGAASLEVYGRLPRLENIALSPDGTRIAFIKTEENTRVVSVMALAKREMLGGLRLGQEKVRSIDWADNDHVMIVTSITAVPVGFWGSPAECSQMQVYDVASHKSVSIPDTDRPSGDQINAVEVLNLFFGRVMVRRPQEHTLLFVSGLQVSAGRVSPALMRVDLQTRDSRAIRVGKPETRDWLVDPAGELAAEESYDNDKQRWSLAIRRDGRMQEVASGQAAIEYPRLLGFGPGADTLLMQTPEQGGGEVWRLLSLRDGSFGEPMAEGRAMSEQIEDRATHRLIGGIRVDDTARYVFFDPELQQRWDAIGKAFADERVQFESAAADYRKFIVRVDGARDGLRYELVDLDAHRAESLGDVYEGMKQPFEVRRITYEAADGMKIPAYLTLPRGKAPKNLPLVVLPHGGPATRDTADFDWWPQALADQGYAVLQPNYRGSALGWKFLSAGFGEWGRKMQTDLSDGVRYLAREGIADPARVCIVGASYGGYAALAGAALDPGAYRCAVAVAGIADLKRFLTWKNERLGSRSQEAQRYWDRFMGVSGPDDARLDAISPIRHLEAIKVPVLLIHGRDDTVVPFEQSQLMYDALKAAKKEVQLVRLKDEDHWLSRSGTRLQMLQVSVAFLRQYDPPD